MPRITVPLLLLALTGLALAQEPWEPVAPQSDPIEWSPAASAGRDVYRQELCWQCHARFVRPLDDEHRRWGPQSWKTGARLGPELRGAHRFGADLGHPPSARTRDWLYGYLQDPRAFDAGALMPTFPQLFEPLDHARAREVVELIARYDADGDGRVSFVTDARPAWSGAGEDIARMAELDVAGLRAPPASRLQTKSGAELWYDSWGNRAYEDVWQRGEEQGDGILSLRDVRPTPTRRAQQLVAYLRGVADPRPGFAVRADRDTVRPSRWSAPRERAVGARLYARLCASCHGDDGRGGGPAARYLDTPPTNLVSGPFKYRSTMHGRLPTLADVFRRIRAGLPGTSMPGFAELDRDQTTALARHVARLWGDRPREAPTVRAIAGIPPDGPERRWRAPRMQLASRDDWQGYMRHVLRGKAVYVAFECSKCHGTEGRGDGPEPVAELSDGRRVRARDFRPRDAADDPRRRLRAGASAEELWRTIMAGLDSKAMTGAADYFFGKNAAIGGDGLLHVPLKDPRLFYVGVEPYTAGGGYQEVLKKLTRDGFGDDWALVLYVLHMLRSEDEVRGRVMAWPYVEVTK